MLEELENFNLHNSDSYERIKAYSKPIAIAWEADNSDVIGVLQDRGRTVLMTQNDGARLSDDEILLRCRCTPETEHIEKIIDTDKIRSEFKEKYEDIYKNTYRPTQGNLGDLTKNKDKCNKLIDMLSESEEEFYQNHFEQFKILKNKIRNCNNFVIDKLVVYKSRFEYIKTEDENEKNSFLNEFEKFLNEIEQNDKGKRVQNLEFPIIVELIQAIDDCRSDRQFNK